MARFQWHRGRYLVRLRDRAPRAVARGGGMGILIGETSRRRLLLGAMGAILGVILLDETVVGVALPTIQIDLGLDEVESHWVVNVYMLVLACVAAVAGRLGDMVGHRRLMVLGLLIFGLAPVAARD